MEKLLLFQKRNFDQLNLMHRQMLQEIQDFQKVDSLQMQLLDAPWTNTHKELKCKINDKCKINRKI